MAGDLIWIHFDPQIGREELGRRPAFVLSNGRYNRKTGLMICCPVTSQVRGYAFEVRMPAASIENGGITGAVLADRVKNMDWLRRGAEYAGIAAQELVDEVKHAVAGLLDMQC